MAIGLPFLEGMQERSAWAQATTPVFGFFICTANGVVQKEGNDPERFWPTATGALTTASMMAATDRCTSLLAEHARNLLLVRGINYPNSNGGCAHAQGIVQCLTSLKPSERQQHRDLDGVSRPTRRSPSR